MVNSTFSARFIERGLHRPLTSRRAAQETELAEEYMGHGARAESLSPEHSEQEDDGQSPEHSEQEDAGQEEENELDTLHIDARLFLTALHRRDMLGKEVRDYTLDNNIDILWIPAGHQMARSLQVDGT